MVRSTALVFVGLVSVAPVFGHGPQIQVTVDNNKITTRSLFQNEPYNTYPDAASTPTTVYVLPLAPISAFGGVEWFVQPGAAFPVTDPGIAWGYGWTFTDASHLSTNGMPVGANFVESMVAGFNEWNGSTFSAAAHGAQLVGYRSSGTQALSGSATTSFSYSSITAPTAAANTLDPHGSAFWQLTGDGVIPSAAHAPAGVDDGIYVEQLQLSLANQPGGFDVQSSNPFYFVMFKGVSSGDALAAAESAFPSASIQVIPEPVGVGLLLGIVRLACVRRRPEALS